jgi:hypothetical protein
MQIRSQAEGLEQLKKAMLVEIENATKANGLRLL